MIRGGPGPARMRVRLRKKKRVIPGKERGGGTANLVRVIFGKMLPCKKTENREVPRPPECPRLICRKMNRGAGEKERGNKRLQRWGWKVHSGRLA